MAISPRRIFARAIVAVLLGLATGYAVGISAAADAERGRNLTMKEYVADFEHHKEKLIGSELPMAGAILGGLIMIVVVIGLYELLVAGVDRLLAALDRKKDVLETYPPPGM
jgi:hypothetical protein